VGASLEKKRLHDQEQAYLKGLERELEIGHDIQMSFLPSELPQAEGWEIAASLKAAREVAGDFYDAFTLDADGSICLVIGDVCDKGVGAALFMTLFRSLLRFTIGATNTFGERSPESKLKYAVTLTNNYIENTHGDTGMFATIFFGLLNPKDGVLTYINAGHEHPIILGLDGEQTVLKSTGIAVGVMPDWGFKVEQIQMNKGDLLFAFTDGAPEMTDPDGAFFGKDKLLSLLESNRHSVSDLIDEINTELIDHIGDSNQFDDITLVAVQRLEA
jgi:sigma-B regulation protein RsbU (phosphoserine phosphatase)